MNPTRRLAFLAGALTALAPALAARAAPPPAAPAPAGAGARAAVDETLQRLDALSTLQANLGWRARAGGPGDAQPAEAATQAQGQAAQPRIDQPPWAPLAAGARVAGPAWLARWIELPRRIGRYDVTGMRAWLSLRIDGDGRIPVAVYVDGRRAAEADDAALLPPVLLAAAAQPGRRVLVRVRAERPGARLIGAAQVTFDRPGPADDPRDLRDELAVAGALLAARGAPANGKLTLDGAIAALDWLALAHGDQRAFDRSVAMARALLQPLADGARRMRALATAHAPIEEASLAPWTETLELTRRTFGNTLDLMRRYPELAYAQPSAQLYAWMEEKFPDLFAELRERVREGRWEPVGGMWVQADLDLPDGESLVRQLLHGQRYFIEKLGRPARLGWSPAAFGGSWQLPQLLRQAGIDAFVALDARPGAAAAPPGALFWWESPNGTRLLATVARDAPLAGPDLAPEIAARAGEAPYPELLQVFGIDSRPDGTGRASLEAARRLGGTTGLTPRLELGPARGLFDHALGAAEQGLALPVWRDELALDDHGGAFTTDGAIKQANRRAETLLLEAERFATMASILGEPYPRDDLAEAWRKVLFNQSHAVLAGAGSAAVRLDAARDHAEVRRLAEPVRQRALEALAARADTRGPGTAVVVANPLPWARSELVEVDVPWTDARAALAATGPGGVRAASEILARDPERHTARVRFAATDVPPLGLAVYHLAETGRAAPAAAGTGAAGATGAARAQETPGGGGAVLENDNLRVGVDLRSGCVTSLLDKRSKSELVPAGACANALEAFADRPALDGARTLDADYEKSPLPFDAKVEVRIVDRGPLRAAVEVVRRFRSSRFTQQIVLPAGAERVDVVTDADWHEREVVVKASFPTTVASDVATYEIPYGTIDRPTTRKPDARGRLEVPGLRWADLADGRHGLLVSSDGRAGYDARGAVIRLTLLRGPTWPDPRVDEGRHRFVYALAPHVGDWRRVGAVRRGYELGWPLLAVAAPPHPGPLTARHAFARVEPDDVVLSAVKRAEEDDGLVLRLYETAGETATAEVRLAAPVASAEEINLLERRRRPLPVRDGAITLELGPYEVSSVRVRLAPKAQGQGPAAAAR